MTDARSRRRRAGPLPPAQAARRPPLPPGQLRELVLGHLRAYPQLAFSPTELSHVLHRSRGAIANACHRLVDIGLAHRAAARPERYQATEFPRRGPAGTA
jgi:hypothetical protein